MEHKLNQKRIIVTGAGKGIGRALCLHLAKLKARVIAISRTKSDLDSLKEQESSIEVYQGDISDWDAIEKLLLSIGPVDCLVNNAGVIKLETILELKKETLDNVTEINYKSAFHVLQVVAKQMIHGSIVNISSTSGVKPFIGLSVYNCSKAAMDMMTKACALELGPHKIRVNSVNPGLVSEGMVAQFPSVAVKSFTSSTLLGRLASPEDINKTVTYFLSDDSSMITGTTNVIDGGQLLASPVNLE